MNQKFKLITLICVVLFLSTLFLSTLFLLLNPQANLLNTAPIPTETAVSQTTTVMIIGNPSPKPAIREQITEITDRLESDYILRLERSVTIFPPLGKEDLLSGTGHYYDFVAGFIHFFILDSQLETLEQPLATSEKAQWLKNQLAQSKAAWQVVYIATPPFSSGERGSTPHLQWPYQAWGADAIISEGDAHYERLHNGITYIVNGLASERLGQLRTPPPPNSNFSYNETNGLLYLTASPQHLAFDLYIPNHSNPLDTFTIWTTYK